MKVIAVVPYRVFPAHMGGQKGIALFYKYLNQKNIVDIYTIKDNASQKHIQIFNEIPNTALRYICPILFFSLYKKIKKNHYTHIIFEHPYLMWLMFLIKKTTRIQVILHTHNIESERFKSIGKKWWRILSVYEKYAMRIADSIWFKTEVDLQYAHKHFALDTSKCHVIPYGTEIYKLPNVIEIEYNKTKVMQRHGIENDTRILLFNGTLSYKPNLDALMFILEVINPQLLNKLLNYKIIVCGKGLPPYMEQLKAYRTRNIVYAGFVENIDEYFLACDIFLNPVKDGGGIKTKLVEALGYGKPCISSQNGAIGVPPELCGNLLYVVNDNEAQEKYAEHIKEILAHYNEKNTNHETFYKQFYWENIAQKANEILAGM